MKADLKGLKELGAVLSLVPEIPGHLASTVVRLTTVKDKLQAEMTGLISVCGFVPLEAPEQGEWCIDRRLFLPFVKVGNEKWLTWNAEENVVIAKTGHRQARFEHVDASGYDAVKWEGDELEAAEVAAVTDAVKFALKENTVPELNGVCLNTDDDISEVYSASTLVSYRQRIKTGAPNVKIPLDIAKLFDDSGKVRVTKSIVTIKRPIAFIWQSINARLEKFPVAKLASLMDTEGKKLGAADGGALKDAAERLVAYLAQCDKKFWAIELIPGESEKLTLRVAFPGAEFKETIPGTINSVVKLPLEEFALAASLVSKEVTFTDVGGLLMTSGSRQWMFARVANKDPKKDGAA